MSSRTTAIDQVLSHLPEDQRTAAYSALRAEFASQISLSTSSPSPPVGTTSIVSKPFVKPAAPESFSGTRTKVDQFLIQLRRYLLLANLTTTIDDSRQVEYAAQYLTAEALVWFESVQKSDTPITSLIELETKLRSHFLPYGAERIARTKLRHLQQTQTVQGYSTLFMQTVLHVPNMHVDDQIEAYVAGLKPGIFREVVLKDLKSLQEVMDFAGFVESRLQHRDGGFRSYRNHGGGGNNNSYSSHPPASSTSSNTSSTSAPMDLSVTESELEVNAIGPLKKLSDTERDQLRREGKCFRCRTRGHMSRDCPKTSSPPQQPKNGPSQQ
jgi:hypothetical protein